MHIGVYLFLRTAGPTILGVSLLVGAVVLRKHKCLKGKFFSGPGPTIAGPAYE